MASTARAILAAGLVSLNPWNTVAQAFDGFGAPLDADKFEIKPNSEEKTSESRSHLDFGQARASVIIPKPTEISIELSASSVAALAMQFQGQVQALSQSSGSLTAVDVPVAAIGVWLPLGKRNIAEAGFLVTNSAASTTYVRGTHYEVNWSRGEIRFIPGAAGLPAVAAVVKVTGTYAAVDGKRIIGGAVTQVRAQLRLDGQNMVNGETVEADVLDCTLGTSDGFDFLGSDFSAVKLTGKITGGYRIDFPQRSGE
jgi:hypothetical protein